MKYYKHVIFFIVVAIGLCLAFFYKPSNPSTIPSTISEQQVTPQNQIDESNVVDTYIRENIATIATDKPVLGGKWYVVSTDIDIATDTAVIIYEDGHIQSGAVISYTIADNAVTSITLKQALNDEDIKNPDL